MGPIAQPDTAPSENERAKQFRQLHAFLSLKGKSGSSKRTVERKHRHFSVIMPTTRFLYSRRFALFNLTISPADDLTAEIERNLIAIPQARADRNEIAVVTGDRDVVEGDGAIGADHGHLRAAGPEQQGGRRNLDSSRRHRV